MAYERARLTGDLRELLDSALSRDAAGMRAFVDAAAPIVQLRVARTLLRQRRRFAAARGRDPQQEVEDFVQEVFTFLFEDDARALRAWTPAGGLSLANWVGLLAERQAATLLRSGKRRPWKDEPTEDADLDALIEPDVSTEAGVASREQLHRLLDELRSVLPPRGLSLFYRLVIDEEPIEAICADTGMSADAVYAQKSRLLKLARKIATDIESGALAS